MNIEKMAIEDYLKIKALWLECELSEEPEDAREDIESFLESSQGAGFVAKNNGCLVGAVLCGSDGRYGYIHHLAVSKTHRKQGVGRSLVEACLCFLKRRHVIIMVRKTNGTGHLFWNRLHFQDADWVKVQYLQTPA